MQVSYLAVIEKGTKGFGVFFPDILGCVSQGVTVDEATFNAKNALELHLNGLKNDGDKIPDRNWNGDLAVLNETFAGIEVEKIVPISLVY